MTVGVFTFVLLLGNALKEILPLLISGTVSFGIVARAIGLLIPFVWVFALPMGMLTATLLVFGRFSADQELTAVRASGVSLLSLVTPILALSLLLCGLAGFINMEWGPISRAAYKELYFQLRAEFTSGQLPEGRFIREFKGFIFYVGKNKEGALQDIIVFIMRDETNVTETVRAPRGRFEVDSANQLVRLSLYDGRLVTLGGDRSAGIMSFDELPVELPMSSRKKEARIKFSEMPFRALRGELRRVETVLEKMIQSQSMEAAQAREVRKELKRQMTELESPIRFQLHRQIAFAFASFGFTLVGIPLGIRVHRRETNVGIAIALVLVAVYYGMILAASALDNKPELMPHLWVWVPNLVFQAAGAFMLWRANKGV